MKSNSVYLFVGLIVASFAAQAGVMIEFVKRNADTGKEEPLQSMWVQNGMARTEGSRGSSESTVSIFKDDAMYLLQAQSKSYRVMDKATIERMAGTMNDAMAKMRAQMEKMPPEQRAMMENMMKQRGGMIGMNGPKKQVIYDVKPTGRTETVNGKSCKLWDTTRDGVLSEQLCVVPLSAMPGSDEVIAVSKKMAAMFEKFSAQMRAQMDNIMRQSSTQLAKLNGFPIMTRSYENGVLEPEQFIVKTWKQQAVDAGKFAIPSDYTKKEMPQMGKPMGK